SFPTPATPTPTPVTINLTPPSGYACWPGCLTPYHLGSLNFADQYTAALLTASPFTGASTVGDPNASCALSSGSFRYGFTYNSSTRQGTLSVDTCTNAGTRYPRKLGSPFGGT